MLPTGSQVTKIATLPAAKKEVVAWLRILKAAGWGVVVKSGGAAEDLRSLLVEHRPRVLLFVGHANA